MTYDDLLKDPRNRPVPQVLTGISVDGPMFRKSFAFARASSVCAAFNPVFVQAEYDRSSKDVNAFHLRKITVVDTIP